MNRVRRVCIALSNFRYNTHLKERGNKSNNYI